MSVSSEIELVEVNWARVSGLRWVQPRLRTRHWELRVGDDLVATYHMPAWWSHRAVARTARGAWEVRATWWGRYALHPEGIEEPAITSSRSGLRSRCVRRTEGDELRWRATGWFGRTHVLENDEGFPLLRLQEHRSLLRLEAELELEEAGRALPDLEALVMLAWGLVFSDSRSKSS